MDISKYLSRTISVNKDKPTCLSTGESYDQRYLVAGYLDNSVKFINPDTTRPITSTKHHNKSIIFITISTMGRNGEDPIIATIGKDGTIVFWNPFNHAAISQLSPPLHGGARCISILHGSEIWMLIGSKDSRVLLWDLRENKLVGEFVGHKGPIHTVLLQSFCPEDRTDDMNFLCVASAGADRCVRIWNHKSFRRRKKLRHDRPVLSMALASKGIQPLLVSAGVDRVIRLWDYSSGIQLMQLEGHLDAVTDLRIYEGFEILIISASKDHTLRVFDAVSGECVCTLIGHRRDVRTIGITSCNERTSIVSCSSDSTIRYWDLEEIICDFFVTEDGIEGQRNDCPAYNPPVNYVPKDNETEETKQAKMKRRQQREEKRRMDRLRRTQMKMDERRKSKIGGDVNFDIGDDDDDDYFYDDDDNDDDEDEIDMDFLRGPEVVVETSKSERIPSKQTINEYEFEDDNDDENEGRRYHKKQGAYHSKASLTSQSEKVKNDGIDESKSYANSNSIRTHSVAPISDGNERHVSGGNKLSLTNSGSANKLSALVRSVSGGIKVVPMSSNDGNMEDSNHHNLNRNNSKGSIETMMQSISNSFNWKKSSSESKICDNSSNDSNERDDKKKSTSNRPCQSADDTNRYNVVSSHNNQNDSHDLDKIDFDDDLFNIDDDIGNSNDANTKTSNAQSASMESTIHNNNGIRPSLSNATNRRTIINAVSERFELAQIDREIERNVSKSQASEKLKRRLSMRRESNAESFSVKGAVSLPSVANNNEQPIQSNGNDMEKIKAMKLAQHQMQEKRVKEGMKSAQQRSSQALQKRLEEMKTLRMLNPSLSDSDSDNDENVDNNATTDDYSGIGGVSSSSNLVASTANNNSTSSSSNVCKSSDNSSDSNAGIRTNKTTTSTASRNSSSNSSSNSGSGSIVGKPPIVSASIASDAMESNLEDIFDIDMNDDDERDDSSMLGVKHSGGSSHNPISSIATRSTSNPTTGASQPPKVSVGTSRHPRVIVDESDDLFMLSDED